MEINKYIEHTNLKSNAQEKDIIKLCHEAIENDFEAVVVNPHYISLAKDCLRDTNINVVTVVGFPLGANTMEVKVYEAIDAIEKGADEIDMVANIGAIKDGDFEYVEKEISDVLYSIDGHPLKVIIETSLLTNDEIKKMTKICSNLFVNFIKTSTGFNGNAKLEDIDVINKYKNDILEIKASGGIKTYEDAMNFIEKGVTRIGTSNGVEIIKK